MFLQKYLHLLSDLRRSHNRFIFRYLCFLLSIHFPFQVYGIAGDWASLTASPQLR